jgi:hypothetical protein
MGSKKKLLLVYNADSGKWNKFKDWTHKIVSPGTYPCSLCLHTYGAFSVKKEWMKFIRSLRRPVKLLHRDEFAEMCGYNGEEKLPAGFVYADDCKNRQHIITAGEMDSCGNLHELINLINNRVSSIDNADRSHYEKENMF